MKRHFITFGDGSPAYTQAAIRLSQQARQLNWFHTTAHYDIEAIARVDPNWYEAHSQFIKNNQRGFGYWIWKPKLIFENLLRMAENDILIYLDCGCELNKYGFKMMSTYFDLTQQADFVTFHNPVIAEDVSDENKVENNIKRYVINYFNSKISIVNEKNHMVEAGILSIKNNNKSREFVKNWVDLAVAENYCLINDDSCNLEESKVFKGHRHDQSLLTLALHANDFGVSLRNDTFQNDLWSKNLYEIQTPIHAFRNISAVSRLEGMSPVLTSGNIKIKITGLT